MENQRNFFAKFLEGIGIFFAWMNAKKTKPALFLLMVMPGGKRRPPRAELEYPSNVSQKADYCEGILNQMLKEAVFSSITTEIGAVITLVGKFRSAIIDAQLHPAGKTAERDVTELDLEGGMGDMLHEINKAARNIAANEAIALYERLGVKIWTRKESSKEEIEIAHGEFSGSFDLYVRRPKGRFAVLWMMSTDKENWINADFSHKAHGFVDGLVKGKTYYFRAMTSTKKGKSDWTQVIEIVCI